MKRKMWLKRLVPKLGRISLASFIILSLVLSAVLPTPVSQFVNKITNQPQIVLADSATFGNTSIGGSTYNGSGSSIWATGDAYPGVDGTGISMSFYGRPVSVNNSQFAMALYTSNGTLVAYTVNVTATSLTPNWWTANFTSPPALLASENYTPAIYSTSSATYYLDTAGTNNEKHKATPAWPNPITWTVGSVVRTYSIYVTYTPSGAGTPPTVTTSKIAAITTTSANLTGNVTSTGTGGNVTSRGIRIRLNSDADFTSNVTNTGNWGAGLFSANLTSLSANTSYVYQAFASNAGGISFGDNITFITPYSGIWADKSITITENVTATTTNFTVSGDPSVSLPTGSIIKIGSDSERLLVRSGNNTPALNYVLETNTFGGDIYPVMQDGDFIYAAGFSLDFTIKKYKKEDGSIVWTSPSYGSAIRVMALDSTYVYIAGNNQTVKRYLITDGTYVDSTPSYGGTIRALAVDDTYIFAGGYTVNATKRYLKSDMSYNGTTIAPAGAIYYLTIDGTYIYTFDQTSNVIYQYLKSDMSSVASSPAGNPVNGYGLAVDGAYIYSAGTGMVLNRYFTSNMSFAGASSYSFNGTIYRIVTDATHVYAAGLLGDGKVVKYLKSDLSFVGQTPSYNGDIFGIAIDGNYIYVGGNSTQQQVIKYTKKDLSWLYVYRSELDTSAATHLSGQAIYTLTGEVEAVPVPAAPTNLRVSKGTSSSNITITWNASVNATSYTIWRNSTNLTSVATNATVIDATVGLPSITAGSAVAGDGVSTSYVPLSISGASFNNGPTYTYKIQAYNSSGLSANSTPDTGYTGIGTPNYQWAKTDTDNLTAVYSNIAGATTATYNYTGGNSTAYYLCQLSAAGATNNSTTPNRGYLRTTSTSTGDSSGFFAVGLIIIAVLLMVNYFPRNKEPDKEK